jgi:phosphatidylinositol kinase/protein kinase (PI-3  family)
MFARQHLILSVNTSKQQFLDSYHLVINPKSSSRWLAKAGDDLRQDQRVQHVFRAMNRILALDAQCAQRRLAVQTYKV